MNDTLDSVIPDKITLVCAKCKKKQDVFNILQCGEIQDPPVWICPECRDKVSILETVRL